MNNGQCKIEAEYELQPRSISTASAWIAIVSYLLLLAVMTLAAPPQIVNIMAPAGAFAVGIFLCDRYPLLYVDFVLWVCFLASLVRRLIDYRIGFTNPSPILLAPYLVMVPTIYTVFRYPPKLKSQGGSLFMLVFAGIAYGLCIGLLKSSLQEVMISSLEWLPPATFGWYLVIKWRDYPSYAKRFQRTFFWFVLLAGSYGIYQYLASPVWDTVWLTHMINDLNIVTFGNPEPLGIRVWGTMNGPFVFAVSMSAGLLLLLSRKEPLSVVATIIGILCFLLTQVRSSWIGFIVGLAVLLISMKQSVQIRLILIVMLIAACVVALSSVDSFSEVIGNRVSSLASGNQDNSAIDRIGAYESFLNRSLFNFVGDGFSRSQGSDSGLLDTFIRLGWVGAIPYLSGLLLLVTHPMSSNGMRSDMFAKTTNIVAISLIIQMPMGAVSTGVQGVIFWGFIGMKLSAWKYNSVNQ
jgi:O-Antigen ligase